MEQKQLYVGRLVYVGGVHQTIEFEAENDEQAWQMAHNHPVVDALRGVWVDVQRKPEPQQRLPLEG